MKGEGEGGKDVMHRTGSTCFTTCTTIIIINAIYAGTRP